MQFVDYKEDSNGNVFIMFAGLSHLSQIHLNASK